MMGSHQREPLFSQAARVPSDTLSGAEREDGTEAKTRTTKHLKASVGPEHEGKKRKRTEPGTPTGSEKLKENNESRQNKRTR